MLKKLAFQLKPDIPMPTLRGLILVKALETQGTILRVAPDILGSEEVEPGKPIEVTLECECASEDLLAILESEFTTQVRILPGEANPASSGSIADVSMSLGERVERLAETVVLAQPDDGRVLETIRRQLDSIQNGLAGSGHEREAELARATLGALDALPAAEGEVRDSAWGALNDLVIRLQTLTRSLTPKDRASGSDRIGEGTLREDRTTGEGSGSKTPGAEQDNLGCVPRNDPSPLVQNPELLSCFITESMEHLENAEIHLLTIETDPSQAEAINAVFRAFHTIKGSAGMLGMALIGGLAHEAENLLVLAREGKILLGGSTIDLVFDTVDCLKRLVKDPLASAEEEGQGGPAIEGLIGRIKRAASGDRPTTPESGQLKPTVSGKRIGEALVEAGLATQQGVDEAFRMQMESPAPRRIGEILVQSKQVAAKDVAQKLREQGSKSLQVRETVKVDADRLDQLIDTIGELVIAESMVFQSEEVNRLASPTLLRHLGQLDKITRELQEMGTSLRMVPIRGTFQKMARLVRDLAHKSGKRVELFTSGEETELDKTVVDQIGDPLIHMIRNSVDHGIEANPDNRLRAGKPETGRIDLRAYHKGGNIFIEVQDDGQGLDRHAILSKAIERGLVRETDSLTDREVLNLIFLPGFSTARKVSEVSGRGVGMDVVKRNVEALRGQVEILSEPGMGSIFTIRLPLTLAIIDGMVVRVARERYIIPTLSIIRSFRPRREDLQTVLQRGEMLKVHGNLIPLFRLDRLFDAPGSEQDLGKATIVVVEDSGSQAGIVVDELLGQQQIVIKPLGDILQGTPGLSGGAIMPDGRVGLILDVASLVRLATCEDAARGELNEAAA
ncbi:MAG: chemotaxis protein CheA [Candidatus Omnitrophica bacterium]|nr:chemotaxis protein CheA [Candidatus Omnitrophota bacterium]